MKDVKMTDKTYDILWIVGEISGCHQLPERSFFIKDRQFPICARCTGVGIGYLAGLISFMFIKPGVIIPILFCAVMFVDWLIQYLNILKSNNIRRLITGLLCGYGLMSLSLLLIVKFAEFIAH